EWGFPWQVHCGAYVAFFFTAAILFCVLEVDRVNAERTALEAEQLRKGYRGSIHYADCTQPEDAQRIRHEIGCKSDVVDYAIDVLLSAGMSTPALRDIAREGVDIQRTAYSGVASSVVLLFPVDFITFTFAVVETIYLRGNFLRMLLSSICILERLILATLIYRRSIDERCFILKVMDKIVAALLISFVGLCLMPTVTMRKVSKIWIIGSNIGFALMIAFAVLGIRGTAKLPMGLCWLQFFFARGLTSCAACCCCKSCEAEPSYDPEHQSLRNCSDSESGAPLGFFVNNTVLALLTECGMPVVAYYYYNALCLPFAMYIFHLHRPQEVKAAKGKGCEVFMNSMYHAMDWLPYMLVWFVAKFIGNFVLEDGFPLLFNTFNTQKVPIIGAPDSTEHLIPFTLYTALLWFPAMAAGDTISRRVPQFLDVTVNWKCYTYLAISIVMCVVGEALDFLLLALVTVVAAFIANFGNGFIYGLSAKFIDWKIAEEHRYTAYNLWCFVGDLGGYAGQGALSVWLADQVCNGRHYAFVCHLKKLLLI
ncbi:unnamed protein product, partial [Cladocopium goreaui]